MNPIMIVLHYKYYHDVIHAGVCWMCIYKQKIQCNPGLQSREEKKQQDAKMMEAIQAAAYTNRNVARDPIRPFKE